MSPLPLAGAPLSLPAQEEDCQALEELAREAFSEKSGQRGGQILLRGSFPNGLDAETLSAVVRNSRASLWKGVYSGAVVGIALVVLIELEDGGSIADLRVIYVLPGARGVGVGEALMRSVLSWAAAAGAEGVDSLALPGDRASKNFFEQFGLKARAILVHHSLGS